MFLSRMVAGFCAMALTAALAAAESGPALIRDQWIRDAPATARMRSAYGVITNISTDEIDVVSASSPDFEMIKVHETRIVNDLAKMIELPTVKIAPGQSFQLKPGGAHLMLMQPKRDLHKGDSTRITLTLKSGESVSADFVVGPPPSK